MLQSAMEIPGVGETPVLSVSASALPNSFTQLSGYAFENDADGVLLWAFLPGDFDVELDRAKVQIRFASSRPEMAQDQWREVESSWAALLEKEERLLLLVFGEVAPQGIPTWSALAELSSQGSCTVFALHLVGGRAWEEHQAES